MASGSSCHFCGKECPSLYVCPKCDDRYCSLPCYNHSDHGSCTELFYREWIQTEIRDDENLFDNVSRSQKEDNSVFGKKSVQHGDRRRILDFSKEKMNANEKQLDDDLQRLGISDPNDVEELLESLTDEEKEQFFRAVSHEDVLLGTTSDLQNDVDQFHPESELDPWWSRCCGAVVDQSQLDDILPSTQLYSDISRLLTSIPTISRAAPTICYDIINVVAAYCLTTREFGQSRLLSFDHGMDDDKIKQLAIRLAGAAGSLSTDARYSSFATAVEGVFYEALPDRQTRDIVKLDVIGLCKNLDWRANTQVAVGCKQFIFLSLFDTLSVLRKARKIASGQEEKKTWFRACKKIEFYLKWSEGNWACWSRLPEGQ